MQCFIGYLLAAMVSSLLHKLQGLNACTRLANLTGFTQIDLPVWAAIRPNGRSGSSTVGKGTTEEQSKYSALFECYELTCAERVKATGTYRLSSLNNSYLFHPRHIYSEYIDCCEGTRIRSGQTVILPFSCLTMDTTRARDGYRCSTIGIGAGWTSEQAMNAAIREFIERYSVFKSSTSNYWQKLRVSSMHMDSNKPEINSLAIACEQASFQILVKDITCVNTWPCYAVHLVAKEAYGVMVGRGYGCHKDRIQALVQAILEANQGMCVAASGIRDDMHKAVYLVNRSERNKWLDIARNTVHETSLEDLCFGKHGAESIQVISESQIIDRLLAFYYPRLSDDDTLFCAKVLMPIS